MKQAEVQFETFLVRYLPKVAGVGRAAVKRLRQRLPGCDVLIYDNYNALAAGFSPNGKTGAAILSIALYPRWTSLFFLQAAGLHDPYALLQGKGTTARHIVLASADDLDTPPIRALIEAAIAGAKVPYDPARAGALVIKSVSENQRPRRPG